MSYEKGPVLFTAIGVSANSSPDHHYAYGQPEAVYLWLYQPGDSVFIRLQQKAQRVDNHDAGFSLDVDALYLFSCYPNAAL
jgi:hypothetical protein